MSGAEASNRLVLVDGQPEDYLSQQIIEIDKDKEYGEIRKEIIHFQRKSDLNRWELAARLQYVHEHAIYTHVGYPTWERYISKEVNISVRTADLLRTIFVYFAETLGEQIEDDDERKQMLDKVKALGWTRAKCLVDVCTPHDYEQWFELAQKITTEELQNETRRSLVERQGGDPDTVDDMKTKSFKFSEGQLDIVEQALEIAQSGSDSKKKSNLMSLICQTFVADNMAKDEGMEQNRNRMLTRIAAEYGVDLIAVDPGTKKILMGSELFQRLCEQ